jgi:carboxypeptidase T
MKPVARWLALALFSLCATSYAGAQVTSPVRLLVRYDNVTPGKILSTGIVKDDGNEQGNLVSLVEDTALVILTPEQRDTLLAKGLKGTTVLEGTDELALFRRAVYGPRLRLEEPYHTSVSMNHEIDSLQKARPDLVQVFTIGATTAGDLPIRAVKLSHNVGIDDGRPAVLFNGCHHSNEILGAEICLAILRTFIAGDGTDPDISRWLSAFQIYVVPVINADGYQVVTSGADPRWRKNRRDTDGNGIMEITDGVDLNRNYDFNWAHGGSSDPRSERYRGPFPFSESENQAFASLARSKRFLASLTYHSMGEVIYYPWNWKGRKAPDDSLLTSMARAIAGSIKTMKGDSTYKAEYGAGTVGQSYPWLYGTLGTFDFVVETGWGASFPPARAVEKIVRANLEGVRTFLRLAEGPGVRVKVKDTHTVEPIEAMVWIPSIETEDVHRRTSNPETGIYYRLLLPGSYVVIISAPGYEQLVLRDIKVSGSGWTEIDASMTPVKSQ